MKFTSHLFLRWFTWQNNKQQRSTYYSQHCQASFGKAINVSLKALPPFAQQYRRSARTDGKAVLQPSTALPTLPARGWLRIPGIPPAQQGPTCGLGRARNAWHPHLSPPTLSWAGERLGEPGPWQNKPSTDHCGLRLQVLAGRQRPEETRHRFGMRRSRYSTPKNTWATSQGYYPSHAIPKYFQFSQ